MEFSEIKEKEVGETVAVITEKNGDQTEGMIVMKDEISGSVIVGIIKQATE